MDSDIAGEATSLDGVQQLVMHGKNAARKGECNFSSFGEYETAAAFAKEHCSEIILQPFRLKADGGRSTAETVCRLCQAA